MIPPEYDFRSETLGILDLLELDTTEGPARFIANNDARFVDINGKEWVGSKLISVSEVDFSINGTAPGVEVGLSFIQDPEADDLIAQIREMGVGVIQGREARFYIQYFEQFEEFYKPVFAPQLLTTRTMQNITYSFDGPQVRRVSLIIEGPFSLRAKPVGGRYNTADHSRRCGYANPSLEYMPTSGWDEQSLFGL